MSIGSRWTSRSQSNTDRQHLLDHVLQEMYLRRLSALVGGGKDRRSGRCCVVDMVEAGQAAAFRALEGFAAAPVLEMPVRVVDIFA